MASANARFVVLTALCISALLAAAKLFAVLQSSTSALLASTIHSLIDTSCLALLFLGVWILGLRNASAAPSRPSDGAPDRALYFWSFVVAILLYAMGGGIALYEGVERLARPQALVASISDTLTLALAAAGGALVALIAMRALSAASASIDPLDAAIHRPDIAPTIAVLVISAASIAGNVLALGGLMGASNGGDHRSDPLAAIAVGLAMSAVAAFMAIEVKRLLGAEHHAPRLSRTDPVAGQAPAEDASVGDAEARPAFEFKSMPAGAPGAVAMAEAIASEPPSPAEAIVEVETAGPAQAPRQEPRQSGSSGTVQKPLVTARQAGRKGRGKRRR